MSLETTLADIVARLRQGKFPNEQSSYEDRRVYKLDLFERPSAEAAEILRRYLAYDRVVSGEALEAARKEYRSRTRRTQACTAIPEAWRELVGKGNEDLVNMLASVVESKTGVRPDDNDVAEFLAGLGKIGSLGSAQVSDRAGNQTDRSHDKPLRPTVDPSARSGDLRTTGESSRAGRLILRDKAYPYHNAKDAMVIVLRELAKGDPTFLERCSQHPDAQGRKRRYIARAPEELYPDREDLRDCREDLPGGWLVATNLNNILKRTIIILAAEVAGLTFGKDVIVEF